MLLTLALIACSGPDADLPTAQVAASRDGHMLARPFPHNEMLDEHGFVDLSTFPVPDTDLGATLITGWANQASHASRGFSQLAPIYLRFDGPIDVPASLSGTEADPVRLVSLDSGHQPELMLEFRTNTLNDPYFVDNLLIVQPHPTTPLRSGETYQLLVDDTVANPSDAWPAPEGLEGVAHHTTFTTQDSTGELRTLKAAADAAIDANPDWLQPLDGLKRVASVRFVDGETASGKDSTLSVVTFDDGTTDTAYTAKNGYETDFLVDFTDGPMEVYQATIHTAAFQDLEQRPFSSPGIGLLGDFDRLNDGWIYFDDDGSLLSQPVAEPMRITVMVPKEGTNNAILTWDHGTGGSAYNAINRDNQDDEFVQIRQIFADAGVAVVSRDQPMYGTRYPLIDEGFGASLGFYNVGNLPAFRDNQRQASVDHRVLHRFSTEVLPGLLDDGRIDPDRVGAFGHSLGSVTVHLGLAGADGDGASSALLSGAGGDFTYYAIETGLLGSGNDLVRLLGALLDVNLDDNPPPAHAVGALLGVPEDAWSRVDAMHPGLGLFQLIMDPSDPLVVAPDQVVPETTVLGIGDLQVYNETTRWLDAATPDSELHDCQPTWDYDGHQCMFRETEGLAVLKAYAESL